MEIRFGSSSGLDSDSDFALVSTWTETWAQAQMLAQAETWAQAQIWAQIQTHT